VTADDVVVVNPGIHYNDRSLFTGHLRVLHSQLTSMWADRDFRARSPTVLFAESTPQHFPAQAEGQANGYYSQLTTGFQGERKCRPFVGANPTAEERQRVYESDWRNRVVEQELGDLMDRPFITRVPLAAGLYD
jgi:hypothetical protein